VETAEIRRTSSHRGFHPPIFGTIDRRQSVTQKSDSSLGSDTPIPDPLTPLISPPTPSSELLRPIRCVQRKTSPHLSPLEEGKTFSGSAPCISGFLLPSSVSSSSAPSLVPPTEATATVPVTGLLTNSMACLGASCSCEVEKNRLESTVSALRSWMDQLDAQVKQLEIRVKKYEKTIQEKDERITALTEVLQEVDTVHDKVKAMLPNGQPVYTQR